MKKCARPALAASLLVLLAGCQSYEARPLDLEAHRAAWGARTPADAAEFAQRLAEGGGAPGVFDPADGLSLGEGEVVALFYNRDLRLARLEAGEALASAEHAGLWDDPVLGVDAERILASVPDHWVVSATLGITIPISGRLETEKSRADASHRAALSRLAAAEWDTRMKLRRVWLEWSAVELEREETRSLLLRLEAVDSIVSRLAEAGEMARPAARLFRIERATREGDLLRLDAQARERVIMLRSLMGLAPTTEAQLNASLGSPSPDVTDAELAIAERNPMLATRRAEYVVAEESLRHEIRLQYPDLTIGPGMGIDDGDPRVLLGVSLPLPLWNRNQRAIAVAAAERETSRARFESTYEELADALSIARVRANAAAEQRTYVERTVVPLVDEQEAEVERIAKAGDVDALLTLESVIRQHETRVRLIEARRDEALANTTLEELIGPPAAAPETKP